DLHYTAEALLLPSPVSTSTSCEVKLPQGEVSRPQLHLFCHGCLKAQPDLKKCKGCLLFYYCSRGCQKKDWPLHKNECVSCKEHNGVANMWVRFAMRLAAKWAAGDMGETIVDNGMSYAPSLRCSISDMARKTNCQLWRLQDILRSSVSLSDDIFKRLLKVAWVNSFPLLTDVGIPIGIALCIRLSVVGHSCKPNMTCVF
ncbi:MYND finger, partial [Ostertagia ostertagi]